MKPKTITVKLPLPDIDAFATKQTAAASGFINVASTAALSGNTASGAADRNAFCLAQVAASGELTMNGALACTVMACPRVVTIYCTSDISGDTYTIRGQDTEGRQVIDSVAGPNNTTIRGTKVFSAVKQVHTDTTATSNVEVGMQAIGTPLTTDGESAICRALITATSNESGGTYTLHGLDRYGRYITETGTLPNNAGILSNNNYSRIIGLDLSSALVSTVSLGTATQGESQWVPVERYAEKTLVDIQLSSSADFEYKVQWTAEDVHSTEFTATRQLPTSPYVHLVTQTAGSIGADGSTNISGYEVINYPVSAVRVAVDKYASGSANIRIVQQRQHT